MMKKMLGSCCGLAIVCLVLAGCNPEASKTGTTASTPNASAAVSDGAAPATTPAGLESDICGKCGCCAGCDDCCKEGAAKCDTCGFQKGSDLCCAAGMAPKDVVYCKDCGHVKGTDACCKDECETCTKCGLHKGSDLCCKVKESK